MEGRASTDAKALRALSEDPRLAKLRGIGLEGDIPSQLAKDAEQMADTVIDTYLRRETFTWRYRLEDGTSIRGPGFLSLLGAMYLQMSNFRDAPKEDICKNQFNYQRRKKAQ